MRLLAHTALLLSATCGLWIGCGSTPPNPGNVIDDAIDDDLQNLPSYDDETASRIPVVVVVSETAVFEGQTVILDASSTYDPDEDELFFTWKAVAAYPGLSLGDKRGTTLQFQAPQVDGDTVLQFELSVSDGANISSKTITILIRDLDPADGGEDAEPPGEDEVSPSDPDVEDVDPDDPAPGDADAVPSGGGIIQVPTPCTADTDNDGVPDCDDICAGADDHQDADADGFPDGCDACAQDSDCDDGLFCNGPEACLVYVCGTGPLPCQGQVCDEANDECLACVDDADCTDDVDCTADSCVDGSCVHDDVCPAGNYCNLYFGQCHALDAEPLPIAAGDIWRFFRGQSEPPADWTDVDFDDADWDSGASGLGYNNCSPVTVLDGMRYNYASVYIRRQFRVEDPDALDSLTLTLDYDDSFVAYINGVEVARNNVNGTPPAFDQLAVTNHECSTGDAGNSPNPPEDFSIDPQGLLQPGVNVLAIQGHNLTLGSSDFYLLPTMSSCTTNCSDGLFCNGLESCSGETCVAGSAPCPGQMCDEGADDCAQCLSNGDCSDGQFCNGQEVCGGGTCQAGSAPCPGQMCDEGADECAQCLSNGDCGDGQFCNGQEVCAGGTCQAGNDPCPGQMCNEGADACAECLSNGDCTDGLFCNGQELCVGGTCQAGNDPCPGESCNESADICESGLSCPQFVNAVQIGTVQGGSDGEADVNEASGLVASRVNTQVLWTHNDDWNDNRLFAIHEDGTLLGTYITGSGAQDPEDIAIGPGPVGGIDYLYWGDIGDNNNVRSTIFVKRVPEPFVDANQDHVSSSLSGVDVITLQYPGGADAPSHKDSETLLLDPDNRDLYVVTKRTPVCRVYRAPYPQSTSGVITLQYVGSLSWGGATGGDVSADGSRIIIRRYSGNNPQASIWLRPAGSALWEAFAGERCDVPLHSEPQGEAVGFTPDGLGYLTISENQSSGAQIPVWFFEQE